MDRIYHHHPSPDDRPQDVHPAHLHHAYDEERYRPRQAPAARRHPIWGMDVDYGPDDHGDEDDDGWEVPPYYQDAAPAAPAAHDDGVPIAHEAAADDSPPFGYEGPALVAGPAPPRPYVWFPRQERPPSPEHDDDQLALAVAEADAGRATFGLASARLRAQQERLMRGRLQLERDRLELVRKELELYRRLRDVQQRCVASEAGERAWRDRVVLVERQLELAQEEWRRYLDSVNPHVDVARLRRRLEQLAVIPPNGNGSGSQSRSTGSQEDEADRLERFADVDEGQVEDDDDDEGLRRRWERRVGHNVEVQDRHEVTPVVGAVVVAVPADAEAGPAVNERPVLVYPRDSDHERFITDRSDFLAGLNLRTGPALDSHRLANRLASVAREQALVESDGVQWRLHQAGFVPRQPPPGRPASPTGVGGPLEERPATRAVHPVSSPGYLPLDHTEVRGFDRNNNDDRAASRPERGEGSSSSSTGSSESSVGSHGGDDLPELIPAAPDTTTTGRSLGGLARWLAGLVFGNF